MKLNQPSLNRINRRWQPSPRKIKIREEERTEEIRGATTETKVKVDNREVVSKEAKVRGGAPDTPQTHQMRVVTAIIDMERTRGTVLHP